MEVIGWELGAGIAIIIKALFDSIEVAVEIIEDLTEVFILVARK